MPFYEFNSDINTLCIKATLGIGKTNTLYEFLKYNLNYKYQSCLIVSFRRSLCQKYADDLPNFLLYENIKEKTIESEIHNFVICQVDSIKRIRGKYDLIIFDEFTYVMAHLVSSVEHKKRCHDIFKDIMYEENDIIFMDALLNNDWINYINSFGRRINYVINEYSIHKDKKIYNYNTNKTALIDEIKKSIEKNENIVIASNNKKMLRFINNILENNYKHLKKLFIMKENKFVHDLSVWKNIQVLGYSPSIVAGISFTEKHFDKMFGIFCNSSATADMGMQQLFRVRNISTNEFHICCDITGKNDYPTNMDKIKEMIINEDKCLLSSMENITINYIKKDIVEDEYFNLFMLCQKNRFLSNNEYNNHLMELLKEQGINNIVNIINYNEKNKKELLKQRREFNRQIAEEEAIRIEKARDVTEEEIEIIRENIMRDESDNYILKKHSLKNKFMINNINKDDILKYGKYAKPLWNLAYIYGHENYNEELIKRINFEEKKIDIDDNTKRLGRNRKYEIMLLCIHILNYIGFESPFDTKKIDIDKDKYKEYIIKYHNILELYFKCKKFDTSIFETNEWYRKCKMYINSKLKSIFKISIIEDRKNNKQYIKGIDFWNDKINYKNIKIIENIISTEKYMYEEIEIEENINKNKENGMDDIDAIINALINNENLENKCKICGEDTIFNNKYCIKHKFENKQN